MGEHQGQSGGGKNKGEIMGKSLYHGFVGRDGFTLKQFRISESK